MSNTTFKAITFIGVGTLSWYAGLKFWQPLIIDQLKADGHLRSDIDIPEPEKVPTSWEDVKQGIRTTLHPGLANNPNVPPDNHDVELNQVSDKSK